MGSCPGAWTGRSLLMPTPISRTGCPGAQLASSSANACARITSALAVAAWTLAERVSVVKSA